MFTLTHPLFFFSLLLCCLLKHINISHSLLVGMFGQPNKPIFAPPARSKATIPPRPPSPPMVPPPSPTVAPLLWNRGTSVRPPGNPSAAAASQTHTKPTAFPNPVPHNRCEVSMLLPPPPPRCFKKKKKRESAHNTTQVHSCLAFTLIWWRTVLPFFFFFLHDKPMCSQGTSCTDNTIEHWTEFNHRGARASKE